jgi:hypothetical protein
MTELARLSQILIDEPPVPRATLDELRARSRKRRLKRRTLTVGALVIMVITALSLVQVEQSPSARVSPRSELASYYEAAVNVSNSTLAAVGLPLNVAIPTRVTPTLSTVSTNGEVSYVGAEYCPYCALQRWALLVALSKFGTFSHLDNEIFSSSDDVYPHLASWSFVGATYTSKYFSFDPKELTSSQRSSGGPGGYRRLERMSNAQRVAFDKFNPQGTLPFVDIGNDYITVGASSSPSALEGLTLSQIGSALNNPKSRVAQAIDGSANYLIAAFCSMTGKTLPSICSTPVITEASKALRSGVPASSQYSNPDVYPTQPPTNAPLAIWQKWSVAEHKFWLHAAATFRSPNPKCTVIKISVTGRKLTKPLMGIPAGVWLWGMGLTGKCPPGDPTGLVKHN